MTARTIRQLIPKLDIGVLNLNEWKVFTPFAFEQLEEQVNFIIKLFFSNRFCKLYLVYLKGTSQMLWRSMCRDASQVIRQRKSNAKTLNILTVITHIFATPQMEPWQQIIDLGSILIWWTFSATSTSIHAILQISLNCIRIQVSKIRFKSYKDSINWPSFSVTVCGKPESRDNQSFVPKTDYYLVGQHVSYTCDDDAYTLIGDVNRTCQHNGLWSGETPVCILRMCI